MALPLVRRATYLALKEERDSYRLALAAIDKHLDNCHFEEWHEPTEDAVVAIENILHITLDNE